MKKRITPKTKEELIKEYPIDDLLKGWYFNYWEASNGHFIVEGCEPYGRLVSCEGSDYEDILEKAVKLAREIRL